MPRPITIIARYSGPDTKRRETLRVNKTAQLCREQGWDKPTVKIHKVERKA